VSGVLELIEIIAFYKKKQPRFHLDQLLSFRKDICNITPLDQRVVKDLLKPCFSDLQLLYLGSVNIPEVFDNNYSWKVLVGVGLEV